MPITIDPEIQNLCRPLEGEERAQLEANLLAEGCRDPLVLWGDLLLDGHNRLAICQEHGRDYDTVQAATVTSRPEAVNWVIANQLGRRNLTPAEASYLRGKRYNAEKMTPQERSVKANEAKKSPTRQNAEEERHRKPTAEALSTEMGASPDTIVRDGEFATAVDAIAAVAPAAAREIRSGKAGLTKTKIKEIGKMPLEERLPAFEKAKKEPKARTPAMKVPGLNVVPDDVMRVIRWLRNGADICRSHGSPEKAMAACEAAGVAIDQDDLVVVSKLIECLIAARRAA